MDEISADRRNRSLDTVIAELTADYTERHPASYRQFQDSLTAMPGANTRSVLHYAPFPLVMAGGAGATLTDIDGHRFTDFLNDYTAGLYGHSHPLLQETMAAALRDGLTLGGPNRYEGPFAELMAERFPSVDQIRFCNSGTEANLMAVSLARYATGREKMLAFHGGYHGSVFYYAGGGSPINAPFPTLLAPFNDSVATAALLAEHRDELACILIEPMQGSAGGIPADPAFLAMLQAESAKNGIVLIFDEVMTSRLAPGGLQEKLGIVPDLTSFGKYLGGGNTFGAFGGSRDLMRHFDPRQAGALPHSGTYNNNILSMAAGAAGLSKLYTPDVAVALNARGDILRESLNGLAAKHAIGMVVSGTGSIMAIHFNDPENSDACRDLLHLALLAEGQYIARRGFISLSIVLTEEDYTNFLQAFDRIFERYGDVLPKARDH